MTEQEPSDRERYFAAIMIISQISGKDLDESHSLVNEFLDVYEITETVEYEKLH